MKISILKKVLGLVSSFMLFFLTVGFVVSCCMMLFLTVFSKTMGLTINSQNVATAAKITFLNVILITILFKLADYIRRRIMVERPTKTIVEATEKIMSGDFSIRIKQMQASGMEGFNQISIAINKMAEELSSVETLRTDFIANVSHEMKTPLSIMQNYGTLLQSPNLSEEKRIEYAKGINEASRRLSEMMTNILKLNRLENQQIFPETIKYDLGEQICECLLQFEDIWESKNININTEIEEDVIVDTDAELMALVWNNLFSNAFKFTGDGGEVSITLMSSENYAIVKVKDTGCGMTSDVGTHIFEKFYQGDTSRCVQGNGLGLALVKRVIDIVQGEIEVESTVDIGSTFIVKIRRI